MSARTLPTFQEGDTVKGAWGDGSRVLGRKIGQTANGRVHLFEDARPDSVRLIVYAYQLDGRTLEPVAQRLPTWRGPWPGPTSVRCHTTRPAHPWNREISKPGHHHCGACGHPAFVEVHGYAAGQCECCGYVG